MNIQDEITNIKADIKKIFSMITPAETHAEPVQNTENTINNDEGEI
jgi:hypothetical protein